MRTHSCVELFSDSTTPTSAYTFFVSKAKWQAHQEVAVLVRQEEGGVREVLLHVVRDS